MMRSPCPKAKKKSTLFACGGIAILGALALTILGTTFIRQSPKEVFASGDTGPTETLVEADRISFSLNSSASTPTSHSFRCTVSSTMLEGVSNSSLYDNVFVVVEDEAFPRTFDEAKNQAKAEKEAAEAAKTEFVPAHYTGYVYQILNSSSSDTDIVIPESLNFTDLFYIDVVKIGAEVCRDDKDVITYKNITSISIPKTVTTIETGAFKYAQDAGIRINLEASDTSACAVNWTDSTKITTGYTFDAAEQRKLNLKAKGTPKKFGTGEDFLVGIKNDEYDLPLIISYDVLDANNNFVENRKTALPIASSNSDYDAVGSNVGSLSFNFSVDLPMETAYHVDDTTVYFHNIYKATRVSIPGGGNKTVPVDMNEPYYALPRRAFAKTVSFADVFENRPGSLVEVGDYTKIGIILKRNVNIYQDLMPAVYKRVKAQIDSGEYAVRHQFTSLPQAYYSITYAYNGEQVYKKLNVDTPITYTLIEANGDYEMSFLIHNPDVGPGFSAHTVEKIDFCGFNVRVDLLNVEQKSIINKSETTIRFSSLTLLGGGVAPNNRVNLGLGLVSSYFVYIVLFAVGATIYYFYAKNKFKNDEFRRVNGKKYLKEAIKNGIGTSLIVNAIVFVYARWGLLDSTIVVFNPLDAFVIILVIAAAIYAGFSIRNIINSIKNSRKRKEAIRLHLDQDQDDDGTK